MKFVFSLSGQTHKEDFSTGTAAALAGGITLVCAMPNTSKSYFVFLLFVKLWLYFVYLLSFDSVDLFVLFIEKSFVISFFGAVKMLKLVLCHCSSNTQTNCTLTEKVRVIWVVS